MFLTTVRVRRARTTTCREHGVDYSEELVEVMVHGEPRAIAAVGGTERRPAVAFAWRDERFSTEALQQAVKAALPLMAAAEPARAAA